MPETEELMQRLRRYCAEKRGRQAAIGRALGVSHHRVNDWLNGRVRPGLERALALLRYLKRHKQRAVGARGGKNQRVKKDTRKSKRLLSSAKRG
jgi:transcriptional regulator with XRE-family HTH domain